MFVNPYSPVGLLRMIVYIVLYNTLMTISVLSACGRTTYIPTF